MKYKTLDRYMKSESVSPKCLYNEAMQNLYLHPTKIFRVTAP